MEHNVCYTTWNTDMLIVCRRETFSPESKVQIHGCNVAEHGEYYEGEKLEHIAQIDTGTACKLIQVTHRVGYILYASTVVNCPQIHHKRCNPANH